MIKILLLFFLSIEASLASSIEGECFFEEVYKNAQSQNGILLISQNQIRYEYANKNLFTIVYSKDEITVVDNKTLKIINNLDKEQTDIFLNIADSINEYPYKDNQITIDDLIILFEPGLISEFPRRISVKSKKVNLSIYLYDCNLKPINKLFFNTDPLFPYKK